MSLKVDHSSVIETWTEFTVENKRRRPAPSKGRPPVGDVILVVRTTLETDPGAAGFDSSETDDLLDAVDTALAASPLYAGARIVNHSRG